MWAGSRRGEPSDCLWLVALSPALFRRDSAALAPCLACVNEAAEVSVGAFWIDAAPVAVVGNEAAVVALRADTSRFQFRNHQRHGLARTQTGAKRTWAAGRSDARRGPTRPP